MTGPCLCGDPACGACFPADQMLMICTQADCDWTGKRHECGSEELSEGIVDTCPLCGCECRGEVEGYGHGV